MNDIVEKICIHFGYELDTVVKKKYGKLPEYRAGEVISKILTGNSLQEIFPEIGKNTASSMLNKGFPGKVNSKQSWITYLLDAIRYKRCPTCSTIKPVLEFYADKYNPNGLKSNCKSCSSDQHKQYYQSNIEEISKYNKQYRNTNLDKIREYQKYYDKQYYQEHKPERIAHNAKRRAVKLNATPSWADYEEITKIYKLRPDGVHVDHIIPLGGEDVCGLHCEHNLQYLTSAENLSKSNKFDIETHVHQTEYIPPYLTQIK